jgi:hypothetical protein
MRDRIEPPAGGKAQEWSALFFGLDEDVATAALDDFSKAQVKLLPS